MAARRKALRIVGGLAVAIVVAIVAGALFASSNAGGRKIAGMIARSASSPGATVSIGAIEGALSSAPQVRDISIADADGVWLKIDHASARWTRLALLRGILDIDSLDVGTIQIARLPATPADKPKDERGLVDFVQQGLSWRPPLPVRIGSLKVGAIALEKPALGAAASIVAKGSADLGASGAAARLALDVTRTDAPGVISARADIAGDGARLRLLVDASEPAGGLLARLAALPGLPPVEIHLDGDGLLDAFAAKLDARSGPVAEAAGHVGIVRQGAKRNVTLDLTARLSALLPKDMAALFENQTLIKGAGSVADDGAIALDNLDLQASAFRLDGSATLAPDGRIAGRASVHGLPAQAGAAFSARTLEAEANFGGALKRPEGSLRLLIEDARGPIGSIGHVDLDARAMPENGGAGLDIQAQGRATALAFADAALAQALGDSASLDLRGHAQDLTAIDIGLATLETGAGKLTYSGRAGAGLVDGKANVSIPDLRRFAGIAKLDLKGALTLAATLTGAPRDRRIAAVLSGGVTAPGVGMAALDGLLGQRLVLGGSIASEPEGGVLFNEFSLRGEHVSARIDGAATKIKASLQAKIDLPDLARADARLTGRADGDVALDGSLEKLDATFALAAHDASAIGRRIPGLTLEGAAHDLTGAMTANATLAGTIDGKPTNGKLSVARDGQVWKIDPVDLSVGKASVKGALALNSAALASGRLTLSATDLDDFSAFALQKLAGRLDADVTLDNAQGRQSVAIVAHGSGVHARDASVDRLEAKMTVQNLFRAAALDGQIAVDGLRVAGQTISKARLIARPATNGATALDLSVDARDYALAGRGTLAGGEPMRLDIAQFSATRAGARFALASPATATLRGGAVELKGVAIAAGSGRLTLDGTVGDRLSLVVNAKALPLSLLAIASPSLALDGRIDGEANVGGTVAAPSGDWRVKIAHVSTPQTRANGLPPIDVAASGRLSGGRTTVDADVAIGAASRLKIAGAAPLGAGALDLTVKGAVDAALANPMLAANGQTLSGKTVVDIRLTGPIAAPVVGGSIDLANGAFADPLNGVSLSHIAGRLIGRGRELQIGSLAAQTKNGGAIAVTGHVTVDPAAGMPGSLVVKSTNAQFVDSDLVSATGDLDLVITGPLARAPRATGHVTLRAMDVNVPDRLPANLKPLAGSRHIDARGFAAQMLALERKEKARAAHRSTFDAPIDIAVSAPNRIFVRGRGIDAEFGGDLKISGTIQKPVVDGGFDLRRGSMHLLTQRIDITQGKLTFAGGLVPALDFTAATTAGGVTATIGVTGPASLPAFAFTSTPQLPQDEVLSRLLFAKAAGSLSPFQAVQLAAALAQFSGATAGVDAFEKLRKALGVDSLDIDTGAAGGPSVGVSRYLMNGVNVGVRTGAKPDQSSVNVGVDLFKNFRVQSETRVDGKTSVGVGVEWEY